MQEDIKRLVELVAARVRRMLGEAKLIIHYCLTMMVKGWACRVPGGQQGGLMGPLLILKADLPYVVLMIKKAYMPIYM